MTLFSLNPSLKYFENLVGLSIGSMLIYISLYPISRYVWLQLKSRMC